MSTINSAVDQYGFHRPDDFDYDSYQHFMSSYLSILARRATRWDKFVKGTSKVRRSRKVKRFVRKGIPSELRSQVWIDISGARKRKKKYPGYYERLKEAEIDELVQNSIITDIDRTFPENVHFGSSRNENIRQQLKNVLLAYAVHNPRIGYCQGLNYVAGLLLLITKNEESSFWLLEVMMSTRLPDYYSEDMLALQVEQEVLSELVKIKMPQLHQHIESIGMPYSIFSTKWFICIYIDVLPIETVLRIWDSLFYEGSKVLLRVALTLLSLHQITLLASKDFPQLCKAMKDITATPSAMDCHSFMTSCFELPGSLPLRLVNRLRKEAVHKLRPHNKQH